MTTAAAAVDAAIAYAHNQPPARRMSEADGVREAFAADQQSFSDCFEGAFYEHGGWFDIEGLAHPVRAAPWECVLERFVLLNGGERTRDALTQRAIDASHMRFRVDLVQVDRKPCLYVWRKAPRYCRSVSHWKLPS
ncbi:MAG: hypothetical protein ACKVP3_07945 [Hyphomicrobiaceae bacterium]